MSLVSHRHQLKDRRFCIEISQIGSVGMCETDLVDSLGAT